MNGKCMWQKNIMSKTICTCKFNDRFTLLCSNKCLFNLSPRMNDALQHIECARYIVSGINRDWDNAFHRIEEGLTGIKNITTAGVNEALKSEMKE